MPVKAATCSVIRATAAVSRIPRNMMSVRYSVVAYLLDIREAFGAADGPLSESARGGDLRGQTVGPTEWIIVAALDMGIE